MNNLTTGPSVTGLRLPGLLDLAKKFREGSVVSAETDAAMKEFLAVYARPLKKERQPLCGETMELTRTLAPKPLLLAMHHAIGVWVPPLILTYTGQRTGAKVSSLLRV